MWKTYNKVIIKSFNMMHFYKTNSPIKYKKVIFDFAADTSVLLLNIWMSNFFLCGSIFTLHFLS